MPKRKHHPPADPARDDVAIDDRGRVVDMGQSVRDIVTDMISRGTIIAVIVEVDDNVAVQVFGPPHARVIEILEQALNGLKAGFAQSQPSGRVS